MFFLCVWGWPPGSSLFPYTTLFRSSGRARRDPSYDRYSFVGFDDIALFDILIAFDGETAFITSDRKSTRLNSSHSQISYAVFCLTPKWSEINASTTSSLSLA